MMCSTAAPTVYLDMTHRLPIQMPCCRSRSRCCLAAAADPDAVLLLLVAPNPCAVLLLPVVELVFLLLKRFAARSITRFFSANPGPSSEVISVSPGCFRDV